MTKKLSNEQKAFNKVVSHLGKQRKQSLNSDGDICVYRGPNGLKCAIGCLIPNKEYDYAFEAKAVRDLDPLPACLNDIDINLLIDLQETHDSRQVKVWPQHLRNIGNGYGLDTSIVRKSFGS